MKFYKLILILCITSFVIEVSAQENKDFQLQSYHPVSPTAYNFLKYTEMPVSEYTGIPNISVPLYTIQVDGLSIPVSLSYHAGGIKVSQEASWVGLGWDLQFGSISQEINDIDDYSNVNDGYSYRAREQLMPDYNSAPVPQFYGQGPTVYGCAGHDDLSWPSTVPVYYPSGISYAYNIYTAYYVPINGNNNNQQLGEKLVTWDNYDSEPDVFTANFLGHSIKFTLNFRNTNNSIIKVLNKKGYLVTRTGDNYKIVVPSGEQYFFESNTYIESNSTNTCKGTTNYYSGHLPSGRIWMLTKIITKHNKEILFNYSKSAEKYSNFPSYAEKFIHEIHSQGSYASTHLDAYGESGPILNATQAIRAFSKENRFTLNSITFPDGDVVFSTSNRDDLLGSVKLDEVKVESTIKPIKKYTLNYSYFDASSVVGNTWDLQGSYTNIATKRLRLVSVDDNNDGIHSFSYASKPLPPKNSFAQDYWGFYNGQLSNTTLVPNPSRLNATQLANVASWVDNGNNNSANIDFAVAGMLTSIQYPTGGKVSFQYELNQFDNYVLPDFASTTNQVTSGNGLRIASITHQLNSVAITKKTLYSYSGGKASIPLQISRLLNLTYIYITKGGGSPSHLAQQTDYQVVEMNAHGFINTNTLSSMNCVGYDCVSKQEVDTKNNNTGITKTLFYNTPDVVNTTGNYLCQANVTMPAVKKTSNNIGGSYSDIPENGLEKSIMIYNSDNKLIKLIENEYTTQISDVYNGAKIYDYPSYYFLECPGSGSYYYSSVPQTLIVYYPIFDIESILYKSTTTSYDDNNTSLVTTTNYSYDAYNQLTFKQTRGSNNEYLEESFSHANDFSGDTYASLQNNNWLTEIVSYNKTKRAPNYGNYLSNSYSKKTYTTVNGNIVVSSMQVTDQTGLNEMPRVTTFSQYDNYANPMEYTATDGITNSLLWDYNNEYVTTEAKGTPVNDIAATSFEADGTGQFTYTGTTVADANATTGNNVYQLGTGNITATVNDASKTYIVSLWANNQNVSVNGNNTPTKTGRTINGYTYYEWNVSGASTITIAGASIVNIDELRVYPKDAQMATYTYEPLIGIKTECDANNRITYYEYDTAGRLKLIRDQDRNIIKTYDYKYQQTP